MNRPTAVALTTCLIVLVAYIAVTSASLVRELNSPVAPVESIGGAPLAVTDATNDNKVEIREAQTRSSKRHRFKTVSHHAKPRPKQEPVTLFL